MDGCEFLGRKYFCCNLHCLCFLPSITISFKDVAEDMYPEITMDFSLVVCLTKDAFRLVSLMLARPFMHLLTDNVTRPVARPFVFVIACLVI